MPVSKTIDATLTDSANGNLIGGETLVFRYKLSTDATFITLGSAVTDANGLATMPVTFAVVPATYNIEVDWNGDTMFAASVGTVNYDTSQANQTTTLTENVSPANPTATDTITVSGTLAAALPISGGLVTILLNGNAIGNATTVADGTYAVTLGPLGNGSYSLDVQYAGATPYLPSSHHTTFTVSSVGPPPPPGKNKNLMIGAGVAAVAIVGVALLTQPRSRKRRGRSRR